MNRNEVHGGEAVKWQRLLLSAALSASLFAAPLRLVAEDAPKTEAKTDDKKEDKKESPAKPAAVQAVGKLEDILAEVKAAKAKVLFLNVWSSGCGSCIEEMPALVNAYKKDLQDSKDVVMLGLSLDGSIFDKPEAIERTSTVVIDKGLPYKNLVWTSDLDALTDKWKVSTTPYNALIAADGTLLEKFELPQDMTEVREVIRKKIVAAFEKLKAGAEKTSAPAETEKK